MFSQRPGVSLPNRPDHAGSSALVGDEFGQFWNKNPCYLILDHVSVGADLVSLSCSTIRRTITGFVFAISYNVSHTGILRLRSEAFKAHSALLWGKRNLRIAPNLTLNPGVGHFKPLA
jgi:hypothetical protein